MPTTDPNPLFNEAISNYVTFGLGILVTAIIWLIQRWLSKKRPRRILVMRTSETSLVSVDSTVNTEDLQITFRGKLATSVYFTKFRIVNDSEEIIDSPKIEIVFEQGQILEARVVDTLIDRNSTNILMLPESQKVSIELKYLNPNRLYKDGPQVQIFSSDRLVVKEVIGGGREWRANYVDFASEIQQALDKIKIGTGFLSSIEAAIIAIPMGSQLIRLIRLRGKFDEH